MKRARAFGIGFPPQAGHESFPPFLLQNQHSYSARLAFRNSHAIVKMRGVEPTLEFGFVLQKSLLRGRHLCKMPSG